MVRRLFEGLPDRALLDDSWRQLDTRGLERALPVGVGGYDSSGAVGGLGGAWAVRLPDAVALLADQSCLGRLLLLRWVS